MCRVMNSRLVETVNERFLSYGPARFDKYLVAEKFGPGLGSRRPGKSVNDKFDTTSCPACHNAKGLGPINWPMDSKLISSFVKERADAAGQAPRTSATSSVLPSTDPGLLRDR